MRSVSSAWQEYGPAQSSAHRARTMMLAMLAQTTDTCDFAFEYSPPSPQILQFIFGCCCCCCCGHNQCAHTRPTTHRKFISFRFPSTIPDCKGERSTGQMNLVKMECADAVRATANRHQDHKQSSDGTHSLGDDGELQLNFSTHSMLIGERTYHTYPYVFVTVQRANRPHSTIACACENSFP